MIRWLLSPMARRTSLRHRVKESSVTIYVRPNGLDHLFFAYNPPGVLYQISQHVEALGPQVYLSGRTEQAQPIQIEGEGRKLN